MGGSKRMSELVVQDLAERCSQTLFSMVRFGNVMGSSGSVLPLFQDQIARGGPVTVTHPDVTRFFMTISEAARLVLLAGSFARGGDVFALDMGEPVKIDQLARRMIKGAGFNVVATDDTDHAGIEIRYTGLRPGEKLHDELLITSDMLTTPHPKILRAQEARLTEFELANALRDLRKAIENRNEVAAREVVNRWVEAPDPQAALQQRGA
jgi:FlaA1/EpsC-like NDP-sugar epimerase